LDGSDLQVVAKRMSVAQVREVLQRYSSQSSRMEKLHQLDADLRNNIAMQHRKKQELSEQLAQAVFKIQQLASSRQIYQEVDLKDSALAATSKECDECKDRDFRLRLNIESLKQSIPRFLTKVTKVVHPKPTEAQVLAQTTTMPLNRFHTAI
jgi:predicted RNase H-like nuclease (RuvC/YqgF family)